MRSEATHFISAIWTWWNQIYIMLHHHRLLRIRSRCFASRCHYWWLDFDYLGFISQNFAIHSEALAMPNLFRATLWQERVVVRSPFTLCLTTQSTPMPNRRHWDDSRVSVWTLPLMMNVYVHLLERHEFHTNVVLLRKSCSPQFVITSFNGQEHRHLNRAKSWWLGTICECCKSIHAFTSIYASHMCGFDLLEK